MAHTIDININGGGGGMGDTPGSGSAQAPVDFLAATLERLNNTLNALGAKIGEFNASHPPKKPPKSDEEKAQESIRKLGAHLASTMSNAILTGVSVTGYRVLTNQATAIMGNATARGTFMAQAIGGNANGAFGNYASSLVDVERQRRIANTKAEYEGVGGVVGSLAGTAVGYFSEAYKLLHGGGKALGIVKSATSAGNSMNKLAAGAGAIGVGIGDYYAAKNVNQYTEQEMLAKAAIARRQADASISEWNTSFARWGNVMKPTDVMGTSLKVPLSSAFESRYGASQNYTPILNQIAPFLNRNPLSKDLDLDKVAQSFLKAGFAAQDFSKLTIQSSQFTAVTGQNINKFSDYVLDARKKFGEAFDTGTMQTSLNLMSLGYQSDEAKRIAYQSQFNPAMASNISAFNNLDISQFYTNQALSRVVGFDINEAERTGHISDPKSRNELRSELDKFNTSGKKTYGRNMMFLQNAGGISIERMRSLVQGQADTNESGTLGTDLGQSPGQAAAATPTLQNLLANVANMSVTSQNVTLVSTSKFTEVKDAAEIGSYISPPPVGGRNHSPAKKP